MYVPNRHASSVAYRYGFQGQEKDDEVKGKGNSLNYKFRMHDPRVGRFFAVDPLTSKYPWYSPYQFAGNSVIKYRELEGLEQGQNYADELKYKYYSQLDPSSEKLLDHAESEMMVSNATTFIDDFVEAASNPRETIASVWSAVTNPVATMGAMKDALFDWGNNVTSEDRWIRAKAPRTLPF